MTLGSRIAPVAIVAGLLVVVPAPAAAHGLVGRLDSPLPLVVYLAGAAAAVTLSFAIAFARDGRWRPGTATPIRTVPRPVILALRGLGLIGLALDRGPGHRGWLVERRGRHPLHVGLRLGRAGHRQRAPRSRVGLGRPLRHAPRPGGLAVPAPRGRGLEGRPVSRPARSVARGHRVRRVRVARAGVSGRPHGR